MASGSQPKKKKEFALTEKKDKMKGNKIIEKSSKKNALSLKDEDSQSSKKEPFKKISKERPRILTAEGWKRMQKRRLIKSK